MHHVVICDVDDLRYWLRYCPTLELLGLVLRESSIHQSLFINFGFTLIDRAADSSVSHVWSVSDPCCGSYCVIFRYVRHALGV